MIPDSNKLWPYSRGLALAAIPIILFLSVLIVSVIRNFIEWPAEGLDRWIILFIAIISLIPLLLVLLDFFASSRAVLDIKGVKIDFSKIDLGNPAVKRLPTGISANMGVKGPIISDTSPMDIIAALNETIKSELVVINLGRGESWWVTRLLALAAGAVRAGAPEVFVFIGEQENVPNHFLGWARNRDVLESILRNREQYDMRYQKSIRIAQQFNQFKFPDLMPPNLNLSNEIQRYINNEKYKNSGEHVAEQILMDQLGLNYGYDNYGSLEIPPDQLTSGRLLDLFGHCLYRKYIDLDHPAEKQIQTLIDYQASYVALVRQGIFDSMLKREDGEHLILKALFEQSLENDRT